MKMSSLFLKFVIVLINWWHDFMSSNSVSNHTHDQQIVLPLHSSLILTWFKELIQFLELSVMTDLCMLINLLSKMK